MTLISAIIQACKTLFSARSHGSGDAIYCVALSEQTAQQMARGGQTGAGILHRKLGGLY